MRKLNIRLQSYNKKKVEYEINHDLRTKYTKHIKNNNDNFLYIPGQKNIQSYRYDKTDKTKVRQLKKDITKRVNGVYTYHKKEYKNKYGRNLREDRTNSINRGIFTFPSDLQNDLKNEKFNKQEFMKLGIKTIENMCKELGIQLIYISCHFDETTPHFHFFTSNFDRDLKPITRNKEVGRKIQDLSETYFKNYGFQRGTSKEITGRKNLNREMEKLRNELKQSKEENQKLKNENKILKENLQDLKNDISKHREELREIKKEFTKIEMETEQKKEIYNQVFKPMKKEYDEMIKYIKLLDKKGIERIITNETLKRRIKSINSLKERLKQSTKLREWNELQEVKKQVKEVKKESYDYSSSLGM